MRGTVDRQDWTDRRWRRSVRSYSDSPCYKSACYYYYYLLCLLLVMVGCWLRKWSVYCACIAKFWYPNIWSGREGDSLSDVGMLCSWTQGRFCCIHWGRRENHGFAPQVLLPRWWVEKFCSKISLCVIASFWGLQLLCCSLFIAWFTSDGHISKPTFSTNPSHRRFLLPTGLPHDNGTGPDLSRSSFYF